MFLGERNKERMIKEMKRNWQVDDAGKVKREGEREIGRCGK